MPFWQNKYFFPTITVVLALFAARFMFRWGFYYNMQDDMQLIRQMEFETCLKDGQIPCRWSSRLGYGYGYPIFNFYPPLPYIFGQVFRFFGLPYLETVKYGAILQFISAALAMYLLGSSVFGRLGGLASSVFYTFAPYHALNIFVRGAYNEAWASVFFPLIFYFSRRLILKLKTTDLVFLSLSFSGLLLSHNPMAMIFSPALLLWVFYWLYRSQPKNFLIPIKLLSLSGLFGLCLSAFFTLPLLFETKYVQIDTMFKNYFDFRAHFVSLKQLFISNFWGDGPSVWQEADGMSFMVGYLHWLIPVTILVYSFYHLIKRHQIPKFLILPVSTIVFSFFYLFLTHQKSTFVWLILTPIQKIQFPWRFLNPALFLLSLSVGALPRLISKKLIYLILVLLVLVNFSHFYPVTYGQVSEAEKFSGQAWINQITSGIYDYLPKTARIAPQSAARPVYDQIIPDQKVDIFGQKKGSDWSFFNLYLPLGGEITLSQLYFPNFEVYNHGQKISHQIEPELGRMVISLPAGQHQVYLKLRNTPIRAVSNAISLLSWTSLVIYSTYVINRNRSR